MYPKVSNLKQILNYVPSVLFYSASWNRYQLLIKEYSKRENHLGPSLLFRLSAFRVWLAIIWL